LLNAEQRYWWRIALELKLRKSSGDAFQAFFSDMMEKKHSTDFVRVRAFGSIGDKGCDGYRTKQKPADYLVFGFSLPLHSPRLAALDVVMSAIRMR